MKLQFPGGPVDTTLFPDTPYVPGKHKQTKQYPCDCCGELTPINGSTLVGAPFLCSLCRVEPLPVAGRNGINRTSPLKHELPYE